MKYYLSLGKHIIMLCIIIYLLFSTFDSKLLIKVSNMLKNLSLSMLFSITVLGLMGCNGEKQNASTGIAECDQYINAIEKLSKNLPEDKRAIYNTDLKQFKELAKQKPEEAKANCKTAIESIPSQYR